MRPQSFSDAFFELLDETFEHVNGNYLDRGTSLFETLSGVSALEASRAVSPVGATIAAHVVHIEFYLTVLDTVLRGQDPGPTDWHAIWRNTRAVSAEEWDEIRRRLRDTHIRVVSLIRTFDSWEGKGQVSGALAVLAHTAYHLGAIRQILRVVADPAPS